MPGLEFLHTSLFYELTALLMVVSAIGLIGLKLRQPMIVNFIAAGILVGPSGLNIVHSQAHIELLAQLGIAVLLFLVGLKLDLKLIRSMGVVSLATGLGQVVFTSVVGYFLGLMLGLSHMTSVYVAVALTFSSTIIIVKLLSDKKEVDSLHGRIAIGFLIVQDIVVVLAMMMLSAFGIAGHSNTQTPLQHVLEVSLYGTGMLVLVAAFMRFAATPLMNRIARSPELLITFSIGWAALLAALGDHFGFSKELGGLLAGISLASTPFREALISRLSSLRDFLLLFFFIALGTQLDLSLLGAQVFPAIVFSAFVLIGNPLIVMVIMGAMGYRKRTSFLAGLTVAQISEFSLIFIAMGVTLGHVNKDALGLVTLVGLITIALSVYMITYAHPLYRWMESLLGIFERKNPHREASAQEHADIPAAEQSYDIILFGLGRYGNAIAHHLRAQGHHILGVDFNPDEVRKWRTHGHAAVYGDACDPEFIASLPLGQARWVISAMPQHDTGVTHEDPRLMLLNGLKEAQYAGKIAVSTHDPGQDSQLRKAGAHVVFLPFHDAAERAVTMIHDRR